MVQAMPEHGASSHIQYSPLTSFYHGIATGFKHAAMHAWATKPCMATWQDQPAVIKKPRSSLAVG